MKSLKSTFFTQERELTCTTFYSWTSSRYWSRKFS